MKIALRTFAFFATAFLLLSLAACQKNDRPKIGFLVKMPEQAWFINEQRAATEAGQKLGFDVIKIGVPDGEKVISAIDNLSAQGAEGFVICTPDVRLGPAIVARARQNDMKVITVDDQLVDADGKPLEGVPHLGMSGYKIGMQVGDTLVAEMKKRGWNPDEVRALRITSNELPTARERVRGASDVLLKSGLREDQIFDAPQRTTDTEGGFNAASPILAQHADAKYWLIYALNEESVLGGVRATEQLHIPSENVIGVGINGANEAFAEFSKDRPTGFFATVAVSSTQHGRKTAEMLYRWIKDGVAPPPLTETTGTVMYRDNWQQVKQQLDL
ncbi:MAG TPA: arabinose ABC transporter substrate-binding protein [Steroidobacteraceae bacterium]|nr:arabinose ABC transporter substrate-binding protein [Steroidobacteraceae bacterium]